MQLFFALSCIRPNYFGTLYCELERAIKAITRTEGRLTIIRTEEKNAPGLSRLMPP